MIKGDDIYKKVIKLNLSYCHENSLVFKYLLSDYLIWKIGRTDIKVRQLIGFYDVSMHDTQLMFKRSEIIKM